MAFRIFSEFVNLFEKWKEEGDDFLLNRLNNGTKLQQFTLDALLMFSLDESRPLLVEKLLTLGADLFKILKEYCPEDVKISFIEYDHSMASKADHSMASKADQPISAFSGEIEIAEIIFANLDSPEQFIRNFTGIMIGGSVESHYKFLKAHGAKVEMYPFYRIDNALITNLGPPGIDFCVDFILTFPDFLRFIPVEHPRYAECQLRCELNRTNYDPGREIRECIEEKRFDDATIDSIKKKIKHSDFPMYLELVGLDFEAIDFLIKLEVENCFGVFNRAIPDETLKYLSENLKSLDITLDDWNFDIIGVEGFERLLKFFGERQLNLFKIEEDLDNMNIDILLYLKLRKSIRAAIELNVAPC